MDHHPVQYADLERAAKAADLSTSSNAFLAAHRDVMNLRAIHWKDNLTKDPEADSYTEAKKMIAAAILAHGKC